MAWISVTIRKGLIVEKTSKIVHCNWEDSFAELFVKTSEKYEASAIEKVLMAKTDKFIESHEVPIDAPVYLCHQFNCMFVCFVLVDDTRSDAVVSTCMGGATDTVNAFDILMNRSHEIVLPESKEGATRGDICVRNKVLDLLRSMKLGWHSDLIDTLGKKFVKALSDTLWTLDPHHKQFIDRCCPIPCLFRDFQGFNDWQSKKQKKPQLSQVTLEKYIDLLSDYLMQPWFGNSRWQEFRSAIEELVESMFKYKRYLESHNDHMKELHSRMSPARPCEESFSIVPVAASTKPTKESYSEIECVLSNSEDYEPIFVNEFAPDDRYHRRHWIDNFCLQFPIVLYKFAHGSSIGTLCFVWKTPSDTIDQTKTSQIIAKLTLNQSTYATRAMRKEFIDKYNSLAKTPKSILRNIYKTLVGDDSSGTCSVEKEVDDCVVQALLELDDPQIVIDMREMNGNPKSTRFNQFWQELGQ